MRMFTGPAAACAGLFIALMAATPALAGGPIVGGTGPGGNLGGGGGTGCSGVACYATVWQDIKLSGNAASASGGNGVPVPMPPPPCYMEPMFSGPELYALWKQGGAGFPFTAYIGKIKQDKASNAGYWWQRVINLQAHGNCGLPLLAWVLHGAQPPLPQVPAIDLADYAYDHMVLPGPRLTFNPATRSYVNLPTYVWAGLPWRPPVGRVTATLGNESATVIARPGKLTLSASGGAQIYDSGCTTLGSTAHNPPPSAGPGTTPDCGVTFTAPGYRDAITGSIRWVVTSNYGGFPAITTGNTAPVTVFEIQSLNNN